MPWFVTFLVPVKPIDRPCSHYGATPTIGYEDTYRAASRRWISRHDQVVRAFTRTLSCRTDLQIESEPRIESGEPGEPRQPGEPGEARNSPRESTNSTEKRANFSVLLGPSRYYYDVQIVAVNKDSAREDLYATLVEAVAEKKRKYSALGPFFQPLIFSAGGLMDKDTA
jgi:hypothetical protein